MRYRLAADIGGTFTDLVRFDIESGRTETTKVPTTPHDLAEGIIRGFDELCGRDYSEVIEIVHGTTSGLNAVIERKGAKTAVLVTRGFRDSYEIGRGNHPEMYNVRYRKPGPLVPRNHRFEVSERMRADGSVEVPLDEREVRETLLRIEAAGFESLAICLLNSYANAAAEEAAARVAAEVFSGTVTTSSRVSPESREFERFSTAILNAYVMPVMERYLVSLESALADRGFSGRLSVMNSNGGRMSANLARRHPVRALMSGPIGGVIASSFAGRVTGFADLVAIDMGGTSFDVSMLDQGELDMVMETVVEDIPVLMPTVNVVSVGAGGGSIGWSEVGAMRVGPRSAGARPGPISYGHGGTEVTVTDANLVLGRMDPEDFLGGRMALRLDEPARAFARYGEEHGLDGIAAAEGVLEIAGNTMADAIREVTLWRGRDIQEMTLLAYGGAGPLHAASIAEQLGVRTVIVPPNPGAFSAWGMLHADVTVDRSRAIFIGLLDLGRADFDAMARELESELAGTLADDGFSDPLFVRSIDLRYVGQSYSLNLPVTGDFDAERVRGQFDEVYRQRYGFSSPTAPVEAIGVRVQAVCEERHVPEFRPEAAATVRARSMTVHQRGEVHEAQSHARAALVAGAELLGPAVITELTATTFVPAGWEVGVHASGSLILSRTTNAEDQS